MASLQGLNYYSSVCSQITMGNEGYIYKWATTLWTYLVLYLLGAWYMVKELLVPHRTPTGGRDVKSMEEAVSRLRSEGVSTGTVKCFELDLCSLASVHNFAKAFTNLGMPLHVLVNNAGIMFWPWNVTEDGHEHHWSVNYLGHFLLTHLLTPHMAASSTLNQPSRVVNLSSSVHYIGAINFDDFNNEKDYSPQRAYAQSKLAQMMFTITLNERMAKQGVLALALHPGVVATELFQHVAWAQTFPRLASTFLKASYGYDVIISNSSHFHLLW
ncbi:Dehydrogenase/reductase SDR family member on chromosome X [Portunus trituberculatus]|uniref:Dehydrogenase/reductase SDR family member on chromosome X n=1 Tax=Portunus trituberculatus TaxID=210409 RepID=A0A5B7GZ73_PORTR|nr:Dehydrogenase/reductase SDR family member on chromosome X [Portunus trituberculatus]